ncbi:Fc.00g101780.m01.CDS01 [Cosmosporella sp. VM-42]
MKANSVPVAIALLASTTHGFNWPWKRSEPKLAVDLVGAFKWKNPFSSDAISSFEPSCESIVEFSALEYTLHDLTQSPPEGLNPWSADLESLFSTEGYQYPGTWAGVDRRLHDRNIVLMDYDKLPLPVREWIEEQGRTGGQGKELYQIFWKPKEVDAPSEERELWPAADKVDRTLDNQKVAIFAPAAIYSILPLWVAEKSECKDTLLDLTKYKPELQDGGVIAWMENSKPEKKAMTFQVKAQVLKAKEVPAPSKAASEKAEETAEKTEQTEKVEKIQETETAEKTENAETASKDEL